MINHRNAVEEASPLEKACVECCYLLIETLGFWSAGFIGTEALLLQKAIKIYGKNSELLWRWGSQQIQSRLFIAEWEDGRC